MPSNKPRIATYTTEQQLKKFKIVAAYKGKSMSDFLSQLIDDYITEFENTNGKINIEEK